MALLARRGVSSASYKKIFSQPLEEYPPRVRKLVDMITSRIKEGRTQNLSEWKAYHAIDLAWDTPFAQTTPTLVANIMSQHLDFEQTKAALAEFGLTEDELFLKIKTGEDEISYLPNPPVFVNIFVPLVKAYGINRTAKLFNERNTNPLLEYKPLKATDRNSVACEIVTDLINNLSRWYGYPAVLRQMIMQQVKYGIALAFPREEWHSERQILGDANGIENHVTVKEGLRYVIPDPMRMFFDLKHPLTSINTDSGCDFMGHWHVVSFGDILDNQTYWNRKSIFCGTNWFQTEGAGSFFREIYPCSMRFPVASVSPLKREDKAGFYSAANDRDKDVFLTEFFIKLVPKQWGLGKYENNKMVKSYDHPVWHRFTLAGDDTVIWAAPSAYNPSWFMGYDYDENAARTSSMALECIPWQDHLGNILSQMAITARQNLMKVVFYDNQQIDKSDIDNLKNLGESKYRGVHFLAFDSLKSRVAGLNSQQAFAPVNLGNTSIQELIAMIPTLLQIMDRVLQVSPQEAGGQGTHQQSKYELQQVGGASTGRVAFTSSYIDEGCDAWMQQLYDASMAYHDGTIVSQVSADIPNVLEILDQLGFKALTTGEDKILVHGKKESLRLEGFARTNEGTQNAPDKEASQIIFSVISTLAGQPELAKSVGVKSILALMEFAATLGGAPRGFKLRKDPDAKEGDEIAPNVLQAIQQSQQALMQSVEEKLAKPIAQELGQDKQEIAALQESIKKLEGIFQIAQAANDQLKLKQAEMSQKLQQKDESFSADQKRKMEAHLSGLQQQQDAAALKIEIEKAKAETKIAAERAKSDAIIAAKKKESAAKTDSEPASSE